MKSPDITQLFVSDKTISTLRNKGIFFGRPASRRGFMYNTRETRLKFTHDRSRNLIVWKSKED